MSENCIFVFYGKYFKIKLHKIKNEDIIKDYFS